MPSTGASLIAFGTELHLLGRLAHRLASNDRGWEQVAVAIQESSATLAEALKSLDDDDETPPLDPIMNSTMTPAASLAAVGKTPDTPTMEMPDPIVNSTLTLVTSEAGPATKAIPVESMPTLQLQKDAGSNAVVTPSGDASSVFTPELVDRMQHIEQRLAEACENIQGMADEVTGISDRVNQIELRHKVSEDENAADPDAIQAAMASEAKQLHGNYTFEESVYDATLFVFMEHFSNRDSLLIIVAFVVNLCMQCGVIAILALQLTEDPFPPDLESILKDWRASDGHAYYNADPVTGVSLIARVCALDPGLSMATQQQDLYASALVYGHFNTGPYLSSISIIVFSFVCAMEVRKSIQFVLAVYNVNRTKGRSHVEINSDGLQVSCLSTSRLLTCCIVALCRSTIACVLLSYGSLWLAYTTSVEELLLNASALAFVLDIDELIFGVLAPGGLIELIQNVEPLLLHTSRLTSMAVPFSLFLLIVSFVSTFNLIFVEYVSRQMHMARHILCSPDSNLDFIVGISNIDWLYYANTIPFGESAFDPVIAAGRGAIRRIMDHDPEADMFAVEVEGPRMTKNAHEIETLASRRLAKHAEGRFCNDVSGGELGLLEVASGNRVQNAQSCAELKPYCSLANTSVMGQNVRLLCPVTCGCSDPWSGLYNLNFHAAGCPWNDCRWYILDIVQELYAPIECQDLSLTELQEETGWFMMLGLWRSLNMITNSSVYNDLNNTGCKPLQSVPFSERMLLCGLYDMFSTPYPFVGAGLMCPESCGCYYDYGSPPVFPPGAPAYHPGDLGLCPLQSCYIRYLESQAKYCAAHDCDAAE